MQINVVHNAKKNIVFGVLNRVVVLLCPFIERIVIRNVLNAQYLGLGSLFSSIISVLSLTELGFSSAMVYNMFKPAGEHDVPKVNALLNFYRRVYRWIGTVILLVGLLLIPFLPRLINGSYPAEINLTQLYLVYLGNTAISYFSYAYMNSIIVVHQRDDVKSLINTVVRLGLLVSQMVVLWLTRNYFYFCLLMPVFTVVTNLLTGLRVHQLFPEYRPEGELTKEDRSDIKKLVAGTFIQQACGVTRNSLDSICISAFLGLTLTAIYNNYYVILNGVTSFTGIVLAAFMGGIGNHVATKSREENYAEMKNLDFAYLWLGGWCMICMLCLYQPFMTLWMGDDMLLPISAVILLCVYAYLLKLGDIRSLYSSANGLWWEQRHRAIGETLMNLTLNIVLGKAFGVHGIIIATMVSLFLCNYIWSASIVFKHYFTRERQKDYYRYQFSQSALIFVAAAITYPLCLLVPVAGVVPQLLIRLAICLVVPNVFLMAVYRRTEPYRYLKQLILRKK